MHARTDAHARGQAGLGSRFGTLLLERGYHPKFAVLAPHREGCGGLWEHVYHQVALLQRNPQQLLVARNIQPATRNSQRATCHAQRATRKGREAYGIGALTVPLSAPRSRVCMHTDARSAAANVCSTATHRIGCVQRAARAEQSS